MTQSKRILILGAGSGGISVASRLAKVIPAGAITIIDPSEKHYYQPLWTLAGAGVVPKEMSEKSQQDFIPSGVQWIRDSVVHIDPERKQVQLTQGNKLDYDFLVVALGLRLCWENIPGAKESLGTNGVCSIYEYDQVDKVSQMLQEFRGGNAIFTMPPVPIKCAGAPQKIMYLADEIFRQNGTREKSRIFFATAGKAIFGIPVFAQALEKVVKRKGIEPLFQHQLIGIKADKKIAIFLVTDHEGHQSQKEVHYELLHIVPPMAAPHMITESPLAEQDGDQKGWLSVDKFTLQHKQFKNVFGIGDVTGVPNSKTGAAIRKQAPVVVANLMSAIKGEELASKYDGYSSCPLVTQVGKVILAEFGYDGTLMPTFPVDPSKERRSMWILKRYLLPWMYWEGMLKGRA
ncbi:MAG: NAD(P)/FAD-dependent oxidoreductase [Proteobacteria bacterium]|nr:NAD(P)/FAD-dependent oxidoreductase [Pseudomonadota bacterium]